MRAIIWLIAIIVLAVAAINGLVASDLGFRRPYVLEKLALEAICPFVSSSDHDYQDCRFYSQTGFIYDGPRRPGVLPGAGQGTDAGPSSPTTSPPTVRRRYARRGAL